MIFAALFGFGAMCQATICLTLIQVHTDPKMRGRVMSYLIMAMTGMFPLGSLLMGAISQKIGAPDTLLIQGILALIIVVFFANFLKREKLNKNKLEKTNKEMIISEI
jgi:MFS family permease